MRPTVPAVGLDSRRDRASDQAFRSLEGEEDDVRPAGGEKGTRRHLWSRLGPLLIWRPDTEGEHGSLMAGVILGSSACGFSQGPLPFPGRDTPPSDGGGAVRPVRARARPA